jgi:hypothetical protein
MARKRKHGAPADGMHQYTKRRRPVDYPHGPNFALQPQEPSRNPDEIDLGDDTDTDRSISPSRNVANIDERHMNTLHVDADKRKRDRHERVERVERCNAVDTRGRMFFNVDLEDASDLGFESTEDVKAYLLGVR